MLSGDKPMSDLGITSDLKQELHEIARQEYECATKIQDARDARQVELIVMMKPLMRALSTMRAEIGDVNWLEFNTDLGHCAHITTTTWELEQGIKRTYMISFKTDFSNSLVDYTKYSICTMTGNDGSDGYDLCELESIGEVLARVTKIVGKHMGAVKADQEHKQKRAFLFTRELFAI
jgi:hypothetical protein